MAYGQDHKTEGHVDPDREKADFDAAFWALRNGNAETYRSICEKPKDRDYADLCQQWRTAEATDKQAVWAFPQFVASALTFAGLVITILITAVGTKAAIRAAVAAERAAEAHKFTERAWMSWTNANAERQYDDQGQFGRLAFMIRWENTGNTPALKCVVMGTGKIYPLDVNISDIDFPIPAHDGESAAIVGKNININSNNWIITPDQLAALCNRQIRIFVWSRIEYSDIFFPDETRHTEVCVEVRPAAPYHRIIDRNMDMQIFHYLPCGRQNEAT